MRSTSFLLICLNKPGKSGEKTVEIHQITKEHLHVEYERVTIEITFDPISSLETAHYIAVSSPEGGYAYDGWWGDSTNTMGEAFIEALKGAEIDFEWSNIVCSLIQHHCEYFENKEVK